MKIFVQNLFRLKTKQFINFLLTINFIHSVYIVFYFKLNVIIQISTTDMYVSWDSFEDVEEFQTIAHTFGIQNYELGIGACLIYLRFNVNWLSARNYFYRHEQRKCQLWIFIVVVFICKIFNLLAYYLYIRSDDSRMFTLIICFVHLNEFFLLLYI